MRTAAPIASVSKWPGRREARPAIAVQGWIKARAAGQYCRKRRSC